MIVKPTAVLPLRHLFARLRKSSFVKNVLVVMSGTAGAQVIGFLLTPIISRLFSPSDFGVFGSFGAVLTVMAAAMTLDYSSAIMLPKKKEDAINLLMLSFVSTVLISVCSLVICLLIPTFFMGLLKTTSPWILALLIVAILVMGLNEACQSWAVRVKAFKHTSASQVVRSFSANGTHIGLGYLNAGATGLIIGSVVADILASLNLIRVLIPDLLTFRRAIRWNQMKRLAKEYRDFPLYSASMGVINALSSNMPVLVLSYFYGIAVAGAYVFGLRILKTPMNFIVRALKQVLFQKAGETQNEGGNLASLYVKTTAGLFAIAFLPSITLIIWAPKLFTLIFGSQWQMAGEFSQSLTIWIMFIFCNVPAVLFARIIRIQDKIFIYEWVLLVMRVSTLVLGGLYLSALQTIMVFSLVGAAMNLFLILLVGYIVIKKERLSYSVGI